MRPEHILLAVLLTLIWGCNFVVVSLGLGDIPPLFFCAIRCLFASIPAVFLIKKPAIPWRYILFYGLFMFAMQFGFMFQGMQLGAPPGLSSLLAQTQVFFTLILAGIIFNEKPTRIQMVGAFVAFSGIGLVAMKSGGHIPMSGLFLVLAGALSWSIGNLITKKIGKVNGLALVAWGCLLAFPPIFITSLATEGLDQIIHSIQNISMTGVMTTVYIVYLSTWVGYGLWGFLLNQYPIATVVPFTLLVPVFGMLSAVVFLGEPMEPWKVGAAALILLGLMINLFGPRLHVRLTSPEVLESN